MPQVHILYQMHHPKLYSMPYYEDYAICWPFYIKRGLLYRLASNPRLPIGSQCLTCEVRSLVIPVLSRCLCMPYVCV